VQRSGALSRDAFTFRIEITRREKNKEFSEANQGLDRNNKKLSGEAKTTILAELVTSRGPSISIRDIRRTRRERTADLEEGIVPSRAGKEKGSRHDSSIGGNLSFDSSKESRLEKKNRQRLVEREVVF